MYLTAGRAGASPVGMGAYQNLGGSYAWLFEPPPYDFLAPANSVPMPAPRLGMGCAGNAACGCSHPSGMGLFDGGLDYTTWGLPEWILVGAVSFLAVTALTGHSTSSDKRLALRQARMDYKSRELAIQRKYSRKKKKRPAAA